MFSDFFIEKVLTLRESIPGSDGVAAVYDTTNAQVANALIHFETITMDDLKNLIKKSPNKYCCLDPLPTHLVKQTFDDLAPVMLSISQL